MARENRLPLKTVPQVTGLVSKVCFVLTCFKIQLVLLGGLVVVERSNLNTRLTVIDQWVIPLLVVKRVRVLRAPIAGSEELI